jgi:vacuolar-type H+-ATPase subunit E/Vma4
MGFEKISRTVLAEAEKEATTLIDGAKKSRGDFLKSKKESAEQEADRLCKLRMQAIGEEYNRKLIQIKGAAGKQILDKRNALLRSLFEKAKKEILNWPSEKYAGVMGRLMERAIGSQEGKIRVHPEDRDAFQKVLSELNEGRGNAKISLDQSAPLPERGGFIFVGADFEVDQTLATMLKDIEHDMLPAIASELFPG